MINLIRSLAVIFCFVLITIQIAQGQGQGNSQNDWVKDIANDQLSTQFNNVGIGTSDPQKQLDVNGDARITGDMQVTGTLRVGNNSLYLISTTTNDQILASSNLLTLGGGSSASPSLSSIKVGIGRNPSASDPYMLQVAGAVNAQQIRITGNVIATNLNSVPTTNLSAFNRIIVSTASNGTFKLANGNKAFWGLNGNPLSGLPFTPFIGTTDAEDLVVKTNNIERMRVLAADGKVGIGTATPGNTLDIQGDTDVRLQIKANGSGASEAYMSLNRGNTNSDGFMEFKTGAGIEHIIGMTSTMANNNLQIGGPETSPAIIVEDGTGRVGIGIKQPLSMLHLNNGDVALGNRYNTGTSRFIGLRRSGNDGSPAGWQNGGHIEFEINATNDNAIHFSTMHNGVDGGRRMTIDRDGKVGIGITTPTSLLHVKGGDIYLQSSVDAGTGKSQGVGMYVENSMTLGRSGSDYGGVGFGFKWTATNNKQNYSRASDYASLIGFSSGGFQFKTAPKGSKTAADPNVPWNEVLTIKQDGKVGIGTNAPTDHLHIFGKGDQFLQVSSDDPLKSSVRIAAVVSNNRVESQLQFASRFSFNAPISGGPIMTMFQNGNVGIGTGDPRHTLSILGKTGTATMEMSSDASGTFLQSFNRSGNVFEPFRIITGPGPSAKGTIIMDNGKMGIGIGVNAPNANLEIKSASAGDAGLRLTQLANNTLTNPVLSVDVDGDVVLVEGGSSGADQDWATSGTDLILHSSVTGDVGIGTIAPEAKLHVAANDPFMNGALAHLIIQNKGTSGAAIRFRLDNSTNSDWNLESTNDGTIGFKRVDNATYKMKVDLNGNTSATGFIQSKSDGFLASHKYTISMFHGNHVGPKLLFGDNTDIQKYMRIGYYLGKNQIDIRNTDLNISSTTTSNIMVLNESDGKIGIGTNNPTARLTVKPSANEIAISVNTVISAVEKETFQVMQDGTVYATEVNVDVPNNFPDYVFDEDYDLRTLEDLEKYLDKNHHLPEIPTAEVAEKAGINLAEMQIQLLKKIEELTLYVIDQNKALQEIKVENESLKKRVVNLEN